MPGAVALIWALLLGVLYAINPFSEVSASKAEADVVCGVNQGTDISLQPSHGQVFYVDSSAGQAVDASYMGYRISSTTPRTNLWVQVSDFAGGSVTLANARDSASYLGDLAAGATGTVFFMAKAAQPTTRAQTHLVSVYSGKPGVGTPALLYSCTFTFTAVKETIKANSNKVTDVSSTRVNGQALGSTFTLTVTGSTGTIGSGTSSPDRDMMWLSPVARSSWPSSALRLERTVLRIASTSNNLADNSGNCTGECREFENQLLVRNLLTVAKDIKPNGVLKSLNYRVVYTFRVVGTTAGNIALTPVAQISSGTQIKHTNIPASPPNLDGDGDVTINATATKTVATTAFITETETPETQLDYTVKVSNSGSSAISVDQIVDTPDSKMTYVANSVKVNGSVIGAVEPGGNGEPGTLVFPGPYSVPAASGGTPGVLEISYRMTFDTCTVGDTYTVTNSAYAMIGTLKVGSSPTSYQQIGASGECGEEEVTPEDPVEKSFGPELETQPASALTTTSATLNGVIDVNGKPSVSIFYEYGTDPDLASPTVAAHSVTANPANTTGPFSVPKGVTSLTSGTLYYYRLVATYSDDGKTLRVEGDTLNFRTTTVVSTPTVTTEPATGVTQTEAVLNGIVNPNQTESSVRFVLSENSTLSSGNTNVRLYDDMSENQNNTLNPFTVYSGSFPVAFSVTLEEIKKASGLTVTSGETWYYRAEVLTTSGSLVSSGIIRSFTLQDYTPQTITFTPPSSQVITNSSVLVEPTASSTRVPEVSSDSPSTCSVSAEGAKWRVTFIAIGDCVLSAREDGGLAGGVNYAPAEPVTVAFTITRAPRTILVEPTSFSSPYAHWGLSGPTLVSTPSAGLSDGTKQFQVIGTNPPCSVNASTGVVTFLAPGDCVIRASISQGSQYIAASTDITITIGKRPQNLTRADFSVSKNSETTTLSVDSDVDFSDARSVGLGTAVFTSEGLAPALEEDCGTSGTSLTWDKNKSDLAQCAVTVTRAGNTWWRDDTTTFTVTLSDKQARTITLGKRPALEPTKTLVQGDPDPLEDSISEWGSPDILLAVGATVTEDDDAVTFELVPGSQGCTVHPTTGELSFQGAGKCRVRSQIQASEKYVEAVSEEREIDIGKRRLTVEPPNVTVMYGEPLSGALVNNPSFTGFFVGHDESVLDESPVCTTGYTPGVGVSSPPSVECKDGNDGNYEFIYEPGSITITPRPITVEIPSRSRLVNATTEPDFTVTHSKGSFYGADGLETVLTNPGVEVAELKEEAGAYPLVLVDEGRDDNYDITVDAGFLYLALLELNIQGEPDPDNPEVLVLTSNAVDCNCFGLKPGTEATLTIFSTPTEIETVIVEDDGTCPLLRGIIPGSVKEGEHTLQISGTFPNGDKAVLNQPVIVSATFRPPGIPETVPTDTVPRQTTRPLFSQLLEGIDLGSSDSANPSESEAMCMPTGGGSALAGSSERERVRLADLAKGHLGDLRTECDISVRVMGSHTVARMVVTSLPGVDKGVTPVWLRSSARWSARDVSWLTVTGGGHVDPGLAPVDNANEDALMNVLVGSGLPYPVSSLPELGPGEYVEVSLWGTTYVPGTIVFAVMTSDPVVLGSSVATETGEVQIQALVPLSAIVGGEHRIRLVGERSWPGMIELAGDHLRLTPETIAEISRFDPGTEVTVVVTGTALNGGRFESVRFVALPPTGPWWTLWLILVAALLGLGVRVAPSARARVRRFIAVALPMVLALPGMVLGWPSPVTAVGWWALGLGVLAAVLAAWGPYLTRPGRPRSDLAHPRRSRS